MGRRLVRCWSRSGRSPRDRARGVDLTDGDPADPTRQLRVADAMGPPPVPLSPTASHRETLSRLGETLWVPETRLTLCDLVIFVDEAAEPVASADAVGVGLVPLWKCA